MTFCNIKFRKERHDERDKQIQIHVDCVVYIFNCKISFLFIKLSFSSKNINVGTINTIFVLFSFMFRVTIFNSGEAGANDIHKKISV
jgi:hypothetical protein